MTTIPAVCPRCRYRLDIETKDLECQRCGLRIPSPFGVPIFVVGAELERVDPPSEAFLSDVAAAVGAPDSLEAIRSAYSLRVKMPDPALQTEAEQFAFRLHASGHQISDLPLAESRIGPDRSVNGVEHLDVRLEPLILPGAFKSGEITSVNVRIANLGRCWLSSRSRPPIHISYLWLPASDRGRVGRGRTAPSEPEGLRTRLLIDVPPGLMFTQAVRLQAPAIPGKYLLQFVLVLETVRWLKNLVAPVTVRITEHSNEVRFHHNLAGDVLDYMEQQAHGVRLLNKWIHKHIGMDRKPLVLEIGGNFTPATEKLNIPGTVNADIDLHGLMIRNIAKHDNIKSIVVDGTNLPFKNAALDVIVMFASFHHFNDPVSLLRHLGKKIKPNGLICLMCEPIGHVMAEQNYQSFIEELEKGVCEQSFEIWEYEAMLERAGLEIIEAAFDRGAAMIAARPKPKSWRRLAKKLGVRLGDA